MPIRFGIIGCGRIVDQHLLSINNHPDALLVAVCDKNIERAQAVAQEQGVDWYPHYTDLIERSDIDVLSICTPHSWHVPMAIAAAMGGKHVILEKPLGLDLKKIREMITVFEDKNLKLFPILQVRYNPVILKLKEMIETQALGKIHSMAMVVRWTRPQEYFDKDSWRGMLQIDGPLLFSQGSHYFDIMRWILGPVKSVFAKKNTDNRLTSADDLIVGMLTYPDGAIGTFEFSISTYPKNLECSLTILGDKGSIKLGGKAMNQVETWEVEGVPLPEIPKGLSPNVYAGGMYQGSVPNHPFIYDAAIQTLKGEAIDYITPEDAYQAISLTDAIYRSAAKEQEIFL